MRVEHVSVMVSDSHEIYFSWRFKLISWWCQPLMKYYFPVSLRLSRINFMTVTSTKNRQEKDNVIFMEVAIMNIHHENKSWRFTLMKVVFSWS